MAQQVYEGKTGTGQRGLFTNRFLAWPFTSNEDYERFKANPEAYCYKIGFEYVEPPGPGRSAPPNCPYPDGPVHLLTNRELWGGSKPRFRGGCRP